MAPEFTQSYCEHAQETPRVSNIELKQHKNIMIILINCGYLCHCYVNLKDLLLWTSWRMSNYRQISTADKYCKGQILHNSPCLDGKILSKNNKRERTGEILFVANANKF